MYQHLGVAVSGSTVTISKAGTYVISGELMGFKSKQVTQIRCSYRLERRYHDQHQRANFCYEAGHVYLPPSRRHDQYLVWISSSNNDERCRCGHLLLKATPSPSMVQVHSTLTPAKENNGIKATTLSISQVEPIRSRL